MIRESVTNTAFGDESPHVANLPATINSGDLLVMLHTTRNNTVTDTTPTGWNVLWQNVDGAGCLASCYYRIADGGEGSTVSITISGDREGTAQVVRYSGWFGTGGIEAATPATGISANPDPPSITPSWGAEAGTVYMAAVQYGDDDDAVSASPSGYGTAEVAYNGNGANLCATSGHANRTPDPAASPENPGTYTLAAAEAWVAGTIAIRDGGGSPSAAGQIVTTYYNDIA